MILKTVNPLVNDYQGVFCRFFEVEMNVLQRVSITLLENDVLTYNKKYDKLHLIKSMIS